MDIKQEVYSVFLRLLCHFGPQRWWPRIWKEGNHRDEIIIGAVLTQRTLWKNVENALKKLEDYGITSIAKFYDTDEGYIERLLKSVPFRRRKIRTIKRLWETVKYGVPSREKLLEVEGIGEETADVILLYAYDIPTIVIDEYARRWFLRFFGLNVGDRMLRSYLHFEDTFYLKEMHALLDELGKRYCKRKPLCDDCPLKSQYFCGLSIEGL